MAKILVNKLEASISSEIPVTEVRKLWFAEPETSPNGSPTERVALQEPKTVTQLRFFKIQQPDFLVKYTLPNKLGVFGGQLSWWTVDSWSVVVYRVFVVI